MVLEAYQERWADDFKALKSVLEANIPSDDIRIEHIGSTSVQGLAAKPIIDMDIIYQQSATLGMIKSGLEDLGYYHNGNQGIEGREVFKRMAEGEQHTILDTIRHHLYVCHTTSEELQKHILFRNYLRENATARSDYEKLKYDISEIALQDRKKYASLKEVMAKKFVATTIQKSKEKWRFNN